MSKLRWHLGHLDSLRGIAVLGVLLVHSVFGVPGVLPVGAKAQELAFFGQRGVQLFFIVSAFTLFLSSQNRRDETSPTRNFFIRRFFRLAPMFYLSTLASRLIWPSYSGSTTDIAISLAFLHGLSPSTILKGARGGWSVADEALFYMVLPLLFRWIKSLKQASIWFIVCVPGTMLLLHLLVHADPANHEFYTFFSFIAEFPVFLCGIVAFFIWRDFLPQQPADPRKRELFPVVLFSLLAVLYAMLPTTNAKIVSTSMLLAGVLLLLSFRSSALLVNAPTRFLGKISYSMYLVHFYFMDFLWTGKAERFSPLGHSAYAIAAFHFFGTLFLTVPLSFITWRFIEEPGIRLGRRLIDLLEGRAAMSKQSLVPPLAAATQAGNSPDAQF